ncbi:hypothetical protein PSHT_08698 [Puccinia striiformis]|uniref:Uncharacterized protein n=1 Tax=Puccinia striiformis TaxID=27350 RepID=A0A2S4VM74_9BASI|nr:hypothetical protein PSHT_08698 [Puccinia striiformis]
MNINLDLLPPGSSTTRSNDEENRPPADSTPVDRSDANAADNSPIPSDRTSARCRLTSREQPEKC